MRRYFAILLFPLFLFLGTAPRASGQAEGPEKLTRVGSEQIPFDLVRHSFAEWQRGSFVYVGNRFTGSPILEFFDSKGRQTSTFNFSIPNAGLIDLYDNSIAVGPDGSLAIAGTASFDNSEGGAFLAWISPDRQKQTVTRISPFFPGAVTIASDGTIWLAGEAVKPFHQAQDYRQNLIRHYDKTGKLLGSSISWADFQTDSPWVPPTVGSILIPMKDGIGWYSPRSRSYVELASDGSVVSRLKTEPHPKGAVVQATACSDGNVYVSTDLSIADSADEFHWGFYILDRDKGTWTLQSTGERSGLLFGCDGTRLATTSDFRTIAWLSPGTK